jgi:putative ABC transport system permease protein
MSPPRAKYQAPDDRAAFYGQVLARLSAIPGIEAAGGASSLPVSISGYSMLTILHRADQPPEAVVQGSERIVTPDYFRAMSIPLLRGRAFTERDQRQFSPVVIISESLARKTFPGQDPIGRRLVLQGGKDQLEIVGVVADVRAHGLSFEAFNEYYLPYTQRTPRALGMAIRARTDLGSLIPAVKQAVQAVDPDVAIFNLKPMREVVAESVSRQRFSMLLLALFASAA